MLFYLLASGAFFGGLRLLWRPLPFGCSERSRAVALLLGSLAYFPGLALMMWGRLALSAMYNVSTSLGAQLYAGHRLVTSGPFAFVRHPMYGGRGLVAFGSLLIYKTWATLFLVLTSSGMAWRARREEAALAAEFGAQWAAYCRQVPAWMPRFRRVFGRGTGATTG